MRFRSRQRLSRQADFAAVRKEGRRQFGAAFVFSVRRRSSEQPPDLPRFAVVASRRVGRAHVRNLLKRRLRALFRDHQATFPANVDIVVTLKPGADRLSFSELEAAFLAAVRRSGLASERRKEAGDRESSTNDG